MNDDVKFPRPMLVLCIVVAALPYFACGSPDERPPPSPSESELDRAVLVQYDTSTADSRDVFATGGCTEGATQACRIYLPSHNDVQPCFVGQQVCADASWGQCSNAVLVDANAGDAELEPEAP